MTRKEVCKATGLSVKTLRLYEEKGLIAPARERRNGRDYREYTPELVAQLEQIVVLRRALFTMDEIRTMQEHPEKIPDIFHDYQQWLANQERQFQQLRQAADSIRESSLGSIDGLFSGLRGATSSMPLPAMDVKPNFKRLDEIEEGPRIVRPQENFDETVPDAKVFRQVNLMLDRDRANDINIAFGQYNALKKDLSGPVESGAVQGQQRRPKWQRVTGSILTALLLLCLALFVVLTRMTRAYVLWPLICACVLLAARIALAAVPAYLAHRAWLKEAQQADHARQQKRFATDFSGYEKERRRRRKIALLIAAGVVVVVVLVAALCRVLYAQAHPATDLRVCFASPANVFDEDLEAMEAVLAPLVGDLDGNGETVVEIELLYADGKFIETSRGYWRATAYLNDHLFSGNSGWREWEQYAFYLIVDLEVDGYNIRDEIQFAQACAPLPEDLKDTPGSNSYLVDLTGTKLFAAADLEELPVYGCISLGATQEEYDLAVELLRKLLAK